MRVVYGKPKGSLRVATTRCFRKQRVALASQQEWSFCQRVAFESNALLKDIGVFINSTLWKAPITSLLALLVRNRGLLSDKKIILQKLYIVKKKKREDTNLWEVYSVYLLAWDSHTYYICNEQSTKFKLS